MLFSIASFVICWGWNIWLLARAAGGGGSDDVGATNSVATSASGNGLNGLYWLFVSSICFGLFTYGRERGFANALGDVARLPGSLFSALSKSTTAALAMFLWGMLVGLGIGTFMPAAASGVLGAGFLLLALTPVAAVVNNVLIRLFVGIVSNAAPNMTTVLTGMAAPFLMMLGEAAGLLLAMFADLSVGPALGAAAVCGVLAYVLGSMAGRSAPAPATFVFLVVVGLAVVGAFLPGRAAADDGGWAECFDEDTREPCKGFSGIRTWWDSAGASELRKEARTGGFFGGAGAVLGATLGGILGSLAKARGGWKLPGGGFGTQPVGVSGQEAVDVLVGKGVLAPAGDGTYQWAGVDGADAASAKLEGADLGGGKAARVAVDATPGADGLLRPDSVRIDAEVVKTSATFDAGPPVETKAGFDAPAPTGEAKAGFESAAPSAESKVAFESSAPVESKAGFESAAPVSKEGFEPGPLGESKADFEPAAPAAESKSGFESAAPVSKEGFEPGPLGESKEGFEPGPLGESKADFEPGAPGESKEGFEPGAPAAESKSGFESAAPAGESKADFEPAAPAAESKSGFEPGAPTAESKAGFEPGTEPEPTPASEATAPSESKVGAEADEAPDGAGDKAAEVTQPPPEDVLPDEDRFRRQRDDGGDEPESPRPNP